jgi:hypothetical protein
VTLRRPIWALIVVSTSSFADMPPVYQEFESPYGDFSVWGNASQGYVWNDRYSFFGSEDEPFNYREISLGGQYRFLNRYSMNVQGEYRDAGESDNLGLRLSQAFVDGYMPVGKDTFLGANLGRIEIPFGLYNRTRDRVDTRPSILLPQSIYLEGLGFRDFLLTGDGGMAYGLHKLTDKSRLESRIAVVRPSFGGVADALLLCGWAEYLWDDRLRLRLTLLQSEDDEQELTFPVFSAQYLWNR